jgi:hypothetical protein
MNHENAPPVVTINPHQHRVPQEHTSNAKCLVSIHAQGGGTATAVAVEVAAVAVSRGSLGGGAVVVVGAAMAVPPRMPWGQ